MAKLTDVQLNVLRHRCVKAIQRNYTLAQADHHIKALADETGVRSTPQGVKKGSAAHLLSLIEEALAQRSGTKSKPKAAPKPPPPPKPEPEPESEPAPESEGVPPYSEWTKRELIAEAEARGLEVGHRMNKTGVIALLEEDDAG